MSDTEFRERNKKEIGEVKAVINGARSAGIAIGKHLMNMGVKNLTFCDRFGIICEGNKNNNPAQEEVAKVTNLEHKRELFPMHLQELRQLLKLPEKPALQGYNLI